MDTSQKRIKMKITVLGDPRCGKSSFIRNLINEPFQPQYYPTEDYEITVLNIKNSNIDYEIHLWECGAKHFDNNKFLRKAFFNNSSATFLVFDLCNSHWKENLPKWIEEAYNCESFLIYAIGTKKDLYEQKSLQQKLWLLEHNKQQKTLFRQSNLQQINEGYEQENNLFFSQYQIRHFYQAATEKVQYEIKNIFVSIHDDKQKLSRSSLARGTKFDNSLVEGSTNRKAKKYAHNQSVNFGSVRISVFDDTK